jgi:2-polyprenyl-3-methyl-5-hydroxy-6-metoxy-1,4-benzoquinol methylase
MLRRIERWAGKEGIAVRLTGIDLNPYAAQAAGSMTPPSSKIEWITGNAFSYQPETPIDVVLCSLFTHHLPDEEIVRFLQWAERVSIRGWFVNDLHRERLPYYGFQLLARVMRWHSFVQHDGPVSIRRSFRHEDWQRYLAQAEISIANVQLQTFRPARLCLGRVKP